MSFEFFSLLSLLCRVVLSSSSCVQEESSSCFSKNHTFCRSLMHFTCRRCSTLYCVRRRERRKMEKKYFRLVLPNMEQYYIHFFLFSVKRPETTRIFEFLSLTRKKHTANFIQKKKLLSLCIVWEDMRWRDDENSQKLEWNGKEKWKKELFSSFLCWSKSKNENWNKRALF